MRRNLLTWTAVLLGVWASVAYLVYGPTLLIGRVIFGAGLLSIPALVWIRALRLEPMKRLEMVTSFVAIVLAFPIGLGLVLTSLPSGFTATTWSIGLGAIGTVGVAVALVRGASPLPLSEPIRVRLPLASAAALAFGAAFIAIGAAASVSSAHNANHDTFTELSLVPQGAGHTARETTSALLTIKNDEHRYMKYRLTYTSGGRTINTRVALAAGKTYYAKEVVRNGAAIARLYVGSSQRVYRSAWLGGRRR